MFGLRLREARKIRGLRAQDLAKTLELELRTYYHYENGKREPSFDVVVRIADYLDVSLDYLFGRDEFIKKHTSGSEQHPE